MCRLLFAAFAALLASGAVAHADPVTYTLTGTFSGELGAVSFTGAAGTFTVSTDTAATVNNGGGFYTNQSGVATFTVDGLTAIFLSPTFGVTSGTYDAGFYDTNSTFGANDYDPNNPNFYSYALTAPFSDTGYLLGNFGTTELTSLGLLTLFGDSGSTATFTAVGPTPEPSSLLLLGTGLVGAVAATRRRFGSLR